MKPIDYVVPMVFCDDPVWQEKWQEKVRYDASFLNLSPRWRSWGTEELLIRCVLRFLPWVRTIHILLADEGQVQPWMRELTEGKDSKVKLVFHRDFIPEEYLPCFVSGTIECFLKNIPDLAEQFIYGNDDIFPVAPLSPTDFFHKGKPCQHHDMKEWHDTSYIINIHMRSRMKCLNMAAADFGKHFDGECLFNGHGLSPLLKSTCEKVWATHAGEILDSISADRTEREVNQYIYLYYQHLSGNYIDSALRERYASNQNTPDEIRDIILDSDAQVVCVNDTDAIDDRWQECAQAAREALEEKLKTE